MVLCCSQATRSVHVGWHWFVIWKISKNPSLLPCTLKHHFTQGFVTSGGVFRNRGLKRSPRGGGMYLLRALSKDFALQGKPGPCTRDQNKPTATPGPLTRFVLSLIPPSIPHRRRFWCWPGVFFCPVVVFPLIFEIVHERSAGVDGIQILHAYGSSDLEHTPVRCHCGLPQPLPHH